MAEKKVSIASIDKIVANCFKEKNTISWHELNIDVKYSIPLDSMIEFIGDVSVKAFVEENGEYIPEVVDMLIKSNLIERFTNIKLPNDPDKRRIWIYNTDLIECILHEIDMQQYHAIIGAINEKIEYTKNRNDALFTAKINELVKSIETIQETIGEIYQGVDREDLLKAVKSVNDSSIDEAKIVKEYMKIKSEGSDGSSAE